MFRKPTTNEFAVGVAMIALFLLGIVVGAGVSNLESLREWVGALSGWIAALAAGTAVVYMHQSNKIQRQAIHIPRVKQLEMEIARALAVTEDIQKCVKKFEFLLEPATYSTAGHPTVRLWTITPSEMNIDRSMNERIFRDVEMAWEAARTWSETPEFDDFEEEELASMKPLTEAQLLGLEITNKMLMNAYTDLHEHVIEPRREQLRHLLTEIK